MNRELGRQVVGAKPAAAADDVRQWPLPSMDEGPRQPEPNAFGITLPQQAPVSEEEELTVKPLTADELEAMREAARVEGLAEGRLEGLRQGHEEGFASGQIEGQKQGYEAGLQQGLAEGQRQIDEAVAAWALLANQLEQPLQQVDLAVEQQLLQLVAQLSRAVIRCELATNERVIHAVLHEAISALPLNTPKLQLSLNPQDRQLVETAYSPSQLQERGWNLLTDAALERGHCLVASEVSRVEVNPEQDVKELLERFLHQRVTRVVAATTTPVTPAAVATAPPDTTEPDTTAPDTTAPEIAPPEQGEPDAAPEPSTDPAI